MRQNIIDLFSGAGGLTEGFRRPEYNILAHVEMSADACQTLRLRDDYYQLKKRNMLQQYRDFLDGKISLSELELQCGLSQKALTINETIDTDTMDGILAKIDSKLSGRQVHGIIGGPPCQAYSTVGRKRNEAKKETDERIYLYRFYIQFLEHYKPEFFLFENVRGLLSFNDLDGKRLFPKMEQEFESITDELGYHIDWKLVDCSEFGIPQERKRIILYGQRNDLPKFSFFKRLADLKEIPGTVGEFFRDLPKLKAGETCNQYSKAQPCTFVLENLRTPLSKLTQNVARPNRELDLKIYKIAAEKRAKHEILHYNDLPEDLQTHHNKEVFLDRFKALPADGVSQTVVAHIAKDGHYYIHPDAEQNRSITVREAARIQTFPDDFYFMGSRTQAFKQIGNAVPPYLAKKMAQTILLNKQ
ncbi:DNA cytosine methyltransferase [Lacticaseibacillus zeae]|uniref:DNA (cytosine-5-)-methyltransferase n=1 Tax=Lacticaseibacillus zeae subsp. silagei TaxID=3068307 RepID=A0ABD7Z6R5_LACZE|nr:MULTISPECIES: DNA cytosine methyltransferase [Lacticaseibacillus]MDE3315774.1 DNA cytosine methyltransferase [Lacticaseibacillus zeae]OFR91602.1 cytosine methyltransferase [Lactobacillus sp. HMSC068F07]WLV82825.1 DNA cytosine methyltransferase [Lacticaseibacillus sp. NCIMB 15475]WLV85566.1 DNA cytosine methyltransferase [Lacticaseibacillus sp. NCIMB 15474]